MREILLTSSVLILAVLLLRLAFRDRISRRAQYALWGLVLLRLLVPVSLPGVDFSVLSAAEPVGQAVAERLEQRMVYAMPTEVYDYADPGQSGATEPSPAAAGRPTARSGGTGAGRHGRERPQSPACHR